MARFFIVAVAVCVATVAVAHPQDGGQSFSFAQDSDRSSADSASSSNSASASSSSASAASANRAQAEASNVAEEPLSQVSIDLRRNNANSTVSVEELSRSLNQFTQDFYVKVQSKLGSSSNWVFSPFSLHVALSMLASGASLASKTLEELFEGLGGLNNLQALENNYQELLEEYRALNESLLIGNGMWTTAANYPLFKPDYVNRLRDKFFVTIEKLTALGPDGANQVNEWVKKSTHGKIDNLYDSLNNDLALLLTNVVFFKDAWTIAFDDLAASAASDLKFQSAKGDHGVDDGVKWMHRSSYEIGLKKFTFDGLNAGSFLAASIPYKHNFGQRFDMVVVVPESDPKDLLKLHDQLARQASSGQSNNIFQTINDEMASGANVDEVDITMPQFTAEADISVQEILEELGIEGIFKGGELTGISSDTNLKVSAIKHKALIEVDKEGTVGAAATGVELVPLSGAIVSPRKIVLNKPFLFIVRDKKMKVPLFVGNVVDPSAVRKN